MEENEEDEGEKWRKIRKMKRRMVNRRGAGSFRWHHARNGSANQFRVIQRSLLILGESPPCFSQCLLSLQEPKFFALIGWQLRNWTCTFSPKCRPTSEEDSFSTLYSQLGAFPFWIMLWLRRWLRSGPSNDHAAPRTTTWEPEQVPVVVFKPQLLVRGSPIPVSTNG
jgi:hypothetical protein